MARVGQDQEELSRIVKLKELRVVLNRAEIGKPISRNRPQSPLPLRYEVEPLQPVLAPSETDQVTTTAAQNVGVVQEETHVLDQPLHPSGNADSGNTEIWPMLPSSINRVEEESMCNQSQLPYWVSAECARDSCIRRNIQIPQLIDSVQRMNTYMRGLQGKVRELEDENKQFQIQLFSSNAENEKLKNDAAKMEIELQQRDQSQPSLLLRVQESVDNVQGEFQQLSSKVETVVEEIRSAMKDFPGFKEVGNQMVGLMQKLERIEEKMEEIGEAGKMTRLVFKDVVTAESEEESSNEYMDCFD